MSGSRLPIKPIDVSTSLGQKENEIKIVYTGLRKGEKLSEQLFFNEEKISKLAALTLAHVHVPALSPHTPSHTSEERRP